MLKSAQRAATSAIFGGLTLGLSLSACLAFETPQYDKRIEAAAKEIVAKNVGDIRGTVDISPWVAQYGVDPIVTGELPVGTLSAKPYAQFANIIPLRGAYPMPRRVVRKISSFLYF